MQHSCISATGSAAAAVLLLCSVEAATVTSPLSFSSVLHWSERPYVTALLLLLLLFTCFALLKLSMLLPLRQPPASCKVHAAHNLFQKLLTPTDWWQTYSSVHTDEVCCRCFALSHDAG
jgi:hypothetical protein